MMRLIDYLVILSMPILLIAAKGILGSSVGKNYTLQEEWTASILRSPNTNINTNTNHNHNGGSSIANNNGGNANGNVSASAVMQLDQRESPFPPPPPPLLEQPALPPSPVKNDAAAEEECVIPLGMESGKIPSAKITASSSFDVKSVGPQNARVRHELNGGAWCPKSTIERGVKEYLEIDFDRLHRITQTETQGRFGNGQGQEYTESFQLEYWRDELQKWVTYQDRLGRTILEGNTNTYIGVIQQLTPPILASRLRFIPFSIHKRTICMRVEAYGCYYDGGVIHYQTPQGYWSKSPDVDLRDTFYDGWEDEHEVLHGGLGLLTDSLFGPDDFTSPHKMKGNMWIGWNNATQPITLGFQFDAVRKFESVSVHVNNYVSHGAQIFASVDIYFSLDGIKFSEVPLRWTPADGSSGSASGKDGASSSSTYFKNDTSHLVTIPLRGLLANYIRLELTHSNHWLLLSEVFFNSYVYNGNITDNILTLNYLQDGPDSKGKRDDPSTKGTGSGGSSYKKGMLPNGDQNDASQDENQNSHMFSLIMGCLGVFFSLTVISLAALLVMRRNRRNTKLVGGVLGLTPKSMSIGSMGMTFGSVFGGGNGRVGNDAHSDHVRGANTEMTPPFGFNNRKANGSAKSGLKKSKHKISMGKIALCDLTSSTTAVATLGKANTSLSSSVSTGETDDSDEYLYHELVFGVPPTNGSGTDSTKPNMATNTTAAALTNCKRSSSAAGGNQKVKYQRVNHASDFSNDFLGVRTIQDELSYFDQQQHHKAYTHTHTQKSLPSTPKLPGSTPSSHFPYLNSSGNGNGSGAIILPPLTNYQHHAFLQAAQHSQHPQPVPRQGPYNPNRHFSLKSKATPNNNCYTLGASNGSSNDSSTNNNCNGSIFTTSSSVGAAAAHNPHTLHSSSHSHAPHSHNAHAHHHQYQNTRAIVGVGVGVGVSVGMDVSPTTNGSSMGFLTSSPLLPKSSNARSRESSRDRDRDSREPNGRKFTLSSTGAPTNAYHNKLLLSGNNNLFGSNESTNYYAATDILHVPSSAGNSATSHNHNHKIDGIGTRFERF